MNDDYRAVNDLRAGRPSTAPPLPGDWQPILTDLGRVRAALDEAVAHLQLLRQQVPECLRVTVQDATWQAAEAVRHARSLHLDVDRLAGGTPARSRPTSQHDPPTDACQEPEDSPP